MSRPQGDTPVSYVIQWTYKDGCEFVDALTYYLNAYDSSWSLICIATFEELKYNYRVYFSCAGVHQIMPRFVSMAKFLPIFSTDPAGLKTINCRGDKCRREFGPESGVWCTACHGNINENAYLVIDSLMRCDFKFKSIPNDHILYVEKIKRSEHEIAVSLSEILDKIASTEAKLVPGGYYDKRLHELMIQIETERAEASWKIDKWKELIGTITDLSDDSD